MALKTILFLGFFLTLFIVMHGLLYCAVVHYYGIVSLLIRYALRIVLLGLSVSFFLAFFLLHWKENAWTIGFYIFSAVWMGVFINLLLGAGLGGIVILAGKLLRYSIDTRAVANICIVLSVLFSAYGFWNAFHPRVKHLDIALKNLPEAWHNKTIVQLSDVHLGNIHSTGFLEQVVQKVNALNPNLVGITGDLFDGMTRRISQFAPVLKQIRSEKGIFFVTGNHEGYIGISQALEAIEHTGIKVLHNETMEIEGLQIIGVSYPGIRHIDSIRNVANPMSNHSAKDCAILLFHTPSNIGLRQQDAFGRHFSTYWMPDTSFDVNKSLGAQLQLSGHTHSGQIFPFNLLTRYLYKGFHYGLRKAGELTVYTTSGIGTWGPPMRTGTSPEIVVVRLRS